MFNFKERSTADFSSQLPPAINSAKPPTRNKKFCIHLFLTNIEELFEIYISRDYQFTAQYDVNKSIKQRR
jgi:hypothetical protein